MAKVLLTKPLPADLQVLLESYARLVLVADGDQSAFDHELCDSEAVLLSTAFCLDRAGLNSAVALKIVSRTGVGVDNVDIRAASEAGILVLNTPTANTESVAEHAVALIVGLVKQLAWYDREIRQGNFQIRRRNLGHDLSGKKLGLLGCGRIGRLVAKKMTAAFDMSVLAYDPFPIETEGIRYVAGPEELCREVDILSVHMPLLPETKGLLNRERLGLLKPEAYLVNTARGGLVDEIALAEMLRAGRLAGAALDVFADEPIRKDHPLLSTPNTILTPHVAALTVECNQRVLRQAVLGIVDYLAGRSPQFVVNR